VACSGLGDQGAYQAAIRGWDQHRLAEVAGVSQATVSRAMAGGRVQRRTLILLERVLHEQKPLPELDRLLDSLEPWQLATKTGFKATSPRDSASPANRNT
jgi:transcriptional regulator with XRE-family HTH domain